MPRRLWVVGELKRRLQAVGKSTKRRQQAAGESTKRRRRVAGQSAVTRMQWRVAPSTREQPAMGLSRQHMAGESRQRAVGESAATRMQRGGGSINKEAASSRPLEEPLCNRHIDDEEEPGGGRIDAEAVGGGWCMDDDDTVGCHDDDAMGGTVH
jgi:hypothetical protein